MDTRATGLKNINYRSNILKLAKYQQCDPLIYPYANNIPSQNRSI